MAFARLSTKLVEVKGTHWLDNVLALLSQASVSQGKTTFLWFSLEASRCPLVCSSRQCQADRTWSQSLQGVVEDGEAVVGVSELVSHLWRESSLCHSRV